MPLVIATAPAVEPVSLAELKTHSRVTISTDDTYLTDLIKAARQKAESFLRRTIITTEYDLYLDDFPSTTAIALTRPPIQSVTSVKYVDTDSVIQTLTVNTDYVVDTISEPGWVVLPDGVSWPTAKETPNAVVVRFKAGYGDAGSDVEDKIKLAIKHLAAHWYQFREPVEIVRGNPSKISMMALDVLREDRFFEFSR
jgi:uncharacterized phiE125 gp8 family phage protein